MRNSLSLCYEKKKFLYEARPDLFPQGFVTQVEMSLWAKFYEGLNTKK